MLGIEKFWSLLPSTHKIGGKSLVYCFGSYQLHYGGSDFLPMLIPGFDVLNSPARKKLLENASKSAMQILLKQNYEVMSRYLQENGLEPFDFIYEEDLDAVGMIPKDHEDEGQ